MSNDEFRIVRAERTQARLRLALTAASNGGKTWSSILLAKGIIEGMIEAGELAGPLEGKIGMIDTERKSSALYAHLAPFDVVHLAPPYTAARYGGALSALEGAGYSVIIIDQISHAWSGPGGMLALLNKTAKAEYSGNSFQAWANVTPEQDAFIDRLLASPAHLIVTMRQKTEWVLEDKEDRHGKLRKVPRRVGMKPIQRDGVEYDFTTLLGLDTDTHIAKPLKNRCPVFLDNVGVLLDESVGRKLAEWMLGGAPMAAEEAAELSPLERAQGVVVAAEAYLPSCSNIPDLARRFEKAKAQLRAVNREIDHEVMLGLLDRLVAAKEARKVALSGADSVARDLTQSDIEGSTARPEPRMSPPIDPVSGIVGMKDDLPWQT